MAVCPLNNRFPPVGAHITLFLLGGCRPPDPLLFLGGFQPPRPPGGGLQPPVPPCIPRGSASRALRFFLVPRFWKPLTCGYVTAGVFFSEKISHIFGSP